MTRFLRGVVGAAVLVVGLSSCTSTGPDDTAAPEDPLEVLTDPGSTDFLADQVRTVLHEEASGPQVFTVDRPQDAAQLRFYVSCTPDADFTVTMGTFYAGSCGTRFSSSGAIPVPADTATLDVAVDVPAGTEYWVVAVPVA